MNSRRPAILQALAVAMLAIGVSAAPAAGKDKPKGKPGVPDKTLQKRIDLAIKRGAEYLRAVQKQSGKIGGIVSRAGGTHSDYGIGTTALAGLALIAAGDKKGDECLDKAMAFCMRRDKELAAGGSRTTYETGTLLMFIAAYHHGKGKVKKGRRRKTVTAKDKGNPCKLPDDAKAWMRDLALWLVSKQKDGGGWGYPKTRQDLSNTQYALLGLRAARDCGMTVPGRVFKRVAEHMLETQEQDGPKVLRTVGGTKKNDPVYKVSAGDRARGWSYLPNPYLATGSMTTAGIACLAICHDALTRPRKLPIYSAQMSVKVRRAVQDGFAWLDVNFTVQRNPPGNAPAWHFYYLYGLERAAILAGRVLIGQHDWYVTGARYLVGKQLDNGRWSTGSLGGGAHFEASDMLDTAWAILFLKKATKPMPPIQAPVVTPEQGAKPVK